MDSTPDISDTDALTQRRQRLRALADRLLEAIESIPLPDTFLEAERAHKAVRACDTLMVQLYSEPAAKPLSAPRATAASKRAQPHDDDEDDDYDYGPFANLSDALKAEILQYGYDRPPTEAEIERAKARASGPRPDTPLPPRFDPNRPHQSTHWPLPTDPPP